MRRSRISVQIRPVNFGTEQEIDMIQLSPYFPGEGVLCQQADSFLSGTGFSYIMVDAQDAVFYFCKDKFCHADVAQWQSS